MLFTKPLGKLGSLLDELREKTSNLVMSDHDHTLKSNHSTYKKMPQLVLKAVLKVTDQSAIALQILQCVGAYHQISTILLCETRLLRDVLFQWCIQVRPSKHCVKALFRLRL